MTIHQTDVVDWLGVERGTGHVLLTLVDDLDWADEKMHLLLLQEKLNRYLAFIESGEVFEQLSKQVHPVEVGTPIKIRVLAKYEPTTEALRFIEHADSLVNGAGIGFDFKVVPADGEKTR